MSSETLEWLNANTMLGYTQNRDKYKGAGWVTFDESSGENRAWWYQEGFQNGYPGPIPVEEVQRVLFNWEPTETEVWHRVYCEEGQHDATTADGRFFRWVPDDGPRKGIMHPDNEHIFGVFGTETYRVHGYKPWLVDNVANILDAELGIASAGLLRQGGVAYVTCELPDNVTTDSGMDIRTAILAATSLDGTKATVYKMVDMVPVCDNSLDVGLSGEGNEIRIRHSAKSLGKIGTARQALGLIYKHTEEMVKFLDGLSDVNVNDAMFRTIINTMTPTPDAITGMKDGKSVVTNQRAITNAENRQAELWNLWNRDPRVAPWNGTLLGAYAAQNTWNHHYRSHSDLGIERVMRNTLDGSVAANDAEFFSIVAGLDIDLPETLVLVK